MTTNRAVAPVFVVGSPRSGTSFLYHTLLSSGNFVIYQAESDIFNQTAPAFGDLSSPFNRDRMLNTWLESDYFERTGLGRSEVRAKVQSECRNAGDFLRIVMELMARKQNVKRWADNTPTHLLYLSQIKKTISDALFIHVIRDGRDVAMSMNQRNWGGYLFPWDRNHGLLVSGLYWEWLVRKGQEQGRRLQNDYMEIRYEQLVRDPKESLKLLSLFIQHDLDYDKIRLNAIGTVRAPNSSFGTTYDSHIFSPVGRWKSLEGHSSVRLNALLNPFLRELGYPVPDSAALDLTAWRLRAFYRAYRECRHRLKQTPLSKFLIRRDRLVPGRLNRELSLWEGFSMSTLEGKAENKHSGREKCQDMNETGKRLFQ